VLRRFVELTPQTDKEQTSEIGRAMDLLLVPTIGFYPSWSWFD